MFKVSLGREWIVLVSLEDIAVVLNSLDKLLLSQVQLSDTATPEIFSSRRAGGHTFREF